MISSTCLRRVGVARTLRWSIVLTPAILRGIDNGALGIVSAEATTTVGHGRKDPVSIAVAVKVGPALICALVLIEVGCIGGNMPVQSLGSQRSLITSLVTPIDEFINNAIDSTLAVG